MQRHRSVLTVTLVISVALIAGCVGQIPGLPGLGADVVKPARTEISVGVADVIVIEGVQTLPESPILPEQSVRLFMDIVSKDTEPLKMATNVGIKLYDASVFKDSSGQNFCNAAPALCLPTACPFQNDIGTCSLRSGEARPNIAFNLKAPSAAEIANIITRATLSWLLRYDYNTTTSYDVLLVSEQEVLRLQQLGRTLSVPLQHIRGSGPIKIDVSMPTAFGLTTEAGGQDMFITFKFRNVGSGFVKDNKITKDAISIDFSGIGTITDWPIQFDCEGSVCKNSGSRQAEGAILGPGELDFFKKETVPLQFKIRLAPLRADIPHRTFTITASMGYTYELRGSTMLEIRPPALGG